MTILTELSLQYYLQYTIQTQREGRVPTTIHRYWSMRPTVSYCHQLRRHVHMYTVLAHTPLQTGSTYLSIVTTRSNGLYTLMNNSIGTTECSKHCRSGSGARAPCAGLSCDSSCDFHISHMCSVEDVWGWTDGQTWNVYSSSISVAHTTIEQPHSELGSYLVLIIMGNWRNVQV